MWNLKQEKLAKASFFVKDEEKSLKDVYGCSSLKVKQLQIKATKPFEERKKKKKQVTEQVTDEEMEENDPDATDYSEDSEDAEHTAKRSKTKVRNEKPKPQKRNQNNKGKNDSMTRKRKQTSSKKLTSSKLSKKMRQEKSIEQVPQETKRSIHSMEPLTVKEVATPITIVSGVAPKTTNTSTDALRESVKGSNRSKKANGLNGFNRSSGLAKTSTLAPMAKLTNTLNGSTNAKQFQYWLCQYEKCKALNKKSLNESICPKCQTRKGQPQPEKQLAKQPAKQPEKQLEKQQVIRQFVRAW
jgi:hypothetical protein